MNIQSAIINGTKFLKDRYIFNAMLDAEILMAKAIGKDKKYILLNNQKKLKKESLKSFFGKMSFLLLRTL